MEPESTISDTGLKDQDQIQSLPKLNTFDPGLVEFTFSEQFFSSIEANKLNVSFPYLFFIIQIVNVNTMCILYMEHEVPGSCESFLTLATSQTNPLSFRSGHITL